LDEGIAGVYDFISQFDGRVDRGFEQTEAAVKMLEDRARTRRLESEELERRFDVLEEQLHRMDAKLEEKELTITELKSAVDALTNKRCRCNDDKVPCDLSPLVRDLITRFLVVIRGFQRERRVERRE